MMNETKATNKTRREFIAKAQKRIDRIEKRSHRAHSATVERLKLSIRNAEKGACVIENKGHAYLTDCEICEQAPATTTAKFVDARICQDCADTEPGTPGNDGDM